MASKQKQSITEAISGLIVAALVLALLPVSRAAPSFNGRDPTAVGSASLSSAQLMTQAAPAPPAAAHSFAPSQTPAAPVGPPQYTYKALDDGTTPLYQTEPFLNRIAATGGWGTYTNSSATAPVIAVIDTGFELNSQYLAGRLDGAQGQSSWKGWDFVDNDNNPVAGRTDPSGAAVFHGTMTAGLVGLFDPAAKIMPLQALSDEGTGFTSTITAAVNYAVSNGANIISLSLGSSSDDPTLHAAIDNAISHGVLVVAAAGNGGCNCMSYPGNYPEVLSVGASDSSDNLASFSSYGANLDVVAPGTGADVCSSVYSASGATNSFTCGYSGTSFATPLVAGLGALVLQAHPGLSPASIISDIEQGADKVAGMSGQAHTLQYGYGRIDVGKTLTLARSGASTALSGGLSSQCVGFPGATCDIVLTGPSSQVVDLGQQTLDQFGGATFGWNINTLGLAAGTWQLTTTLAAAGDTIALPSQQITISP